MEFFTSKHRLGSATRRYYAKSLYMRWLQFLALTGCFLILGACSRPKPIVVGSKDTAEQRLLGEIAAQHLERRLGIEVKRQLGLGDTRIAYQALLDGQVDLYPEYSGVIVRDLLKDTPATAPDVVHEYARLELKRKSLLEYLKPLGFDSRSALVIEAAGHESINTVSEAAAAPNRRWKAGFPLARESSLPALNQYLFQFGAPTRSMQSSASLFPAMEEKAIDLSMTSLSDGHLTLPKWKALVDDKNVFSPAEAAFLVREDTLAAHPDVRETLDLLSGKISLEAMRKMNAAVEIDQRPVPEVAAEFLGSAGLN